MKYPIKKPTNLRYAIKELGPYIRDDELGYRFECYDGLLLREALGNWLVCAVLNYRERDPERWTFTSEPKGRGADGAICVQATGLAKATEHVMATRRQGGKRVEKVEESAEQLLLEAVQKKAAKGVAYASNTVLVVYLDANVAGYSPRALHEHLPADLAFDSVWVVVPQAGRWDYDVIDLDRNMLDPPTYRVFIAEAFDAWRVERLPWPLATVG